MNLGDGTQLRVGRFLQGDQRVVGGRQRPQNLVELALSDGLLPCLRVLDDEDHCERDRRDNGLEDDFEPSRKVDPKAEDHPQDVSRYEHNRQSWTRGDAIDGVQESALGRVRLGRPPIWLSNVYAWLFEIHRLVLPAEKLFYPLIGWAKQPVRVAR